MPGILPMKVIRVGNSAQSRIAQACDRCRSKKIRCDGIRPQCTQCANVGFECKTSDKLSRRAFPRGYTESLEDRVRGLEAEVRELKDLLDQKDEKIDILSRIHSFSSPSRKRSASLSPPAPKQAKADTTTKNEEFMQVETPVSTAMSDPPSGQSSATTLIDAPTQKVRESETSTAEFDGAADSLVTMDTASPFLSQPSPRMISAFATNRSSMPGPDSKPKSARRQLQSIASRFSSLTKPHQPRVEDAARRATVPRVAAPYLQSHHRTSSHVSLSSTHSLPVFSLTSPPTTQTFIEQAPSVVNLDYLPLGEDSLSVHPNPPHDGVAASPHIDRAQNAEGIDNSSSTKYDDLYSGLQDQILQSRLELDLKALRESQDWPDSDWPMNAVDLYARGSGPQGVLNGSEGSLSSGGDGFSGSCSNNGSTSSGFVDHADTGGKPFKGIMTPSLEGEAIDIDGFVVQN